ELSGAVPPTSFLSSTMQEKFAILYNEFRTANFPLLEVERLMGLMRPASNTVNGNASPILGEFVICFPNIHQVFSNYKRILLIRVNLPISSLSLLLCYRINPSIFPCL
ncbi:hypothetical protein, partial [Candidatus Alkanophaga liquidiphilum]